MKKKRHDNSVTFILFIPLVVFVALFIMANSTFQSGKFDQEAACILPPDPTNAITVQGEQYDQIMQPVEFNSEEFSESKNADWHFKKLMNINGRDVWRVLKVCEGWGTLRNIRCDTDAGNNPAPVNWNNDPTALDLLLIDYSKDFNSTNKYIKYMAVYLKEGVGIPSFIKAYCGKGLPYKPLTYTSELAQQEGVPYTVDPSQVAYVANAQFRFPAGTYTLFMYEDKTGPSGHFTGPLLGNYTTTKADGTTKRYDVYVASFAEFFLIRAPGDPRAYLYSRNVAPQNLFPPTDIAHKNLQLQTFYPVQIGSWGWWNPECKPAIYLYPEQTTDIHVTVDPAGYLTYSDPIYPAGGWQVTAGPNGKIVSAGKTYPYLYYESKIRDGAVTKPTKGYVVTKDALPRLFSTLLPKLGLTEQETTDFKSYWENKLTQSKYYFVGVMGNDAINAIEPLTIIPKADTIIRVRLYFEALDASRAVEAPTIVTPKRNGFVVAEWGGLVKTDKNHPFTCSQ